MLGLACPPRTAFVSCGTWSLVGVERPAPVISPQALGMAFTNEPGAGGSWLLMRNLTGLWLLEQAVQQYREQGGFSRCPPCSPRPRCSGHNRTRST